MEFLIFEEYLKSKKINPDLFLKGDPDLFEEYRIIFTQVHPDSFTAQKLFMINRIRRKYLYMEAQLPSKPANSQIVKPKISIKPKIK